LSEYQIVPKDERVATSLTLKAGVDSSLSDAGMMEEEGTLVSLWHSVRDVFFPVKLPPLVLESKPIPVVDRMATKQDPRATAASFAIYALLILLIAWMVRQHVKFSAPQKALVVTALTTPVEMKPAKDVMGGGGGQRGPTPVTKGQMPDPTIEVQPDLKMANNNMPNLGDPKSPLIGSSMGNGSGSGIGSGNGSGLGPGSGGNTGGGIMHVGGGVSAPVPIYEVTPEFSEEARKAKFQGVVTVNLVVNQRGLPENVHILRGVGMGLDDKAIEAVKQYRFKPAMMGGKPVAVEVNVEVNFQIF
jgi:protein TonB